MTTAPAASRSIRPLIAILLICLAPVVFALLAYYVPALGLRPDTRTSYGVLIEPQRPIPVNLALRDEQGQPYDLNQLKGQWLLISAGPGACPESCVRGLFVLRNSHASQGKEVDRLERIWFVTDDAPAAPVVEQAYAGTHVLRADPARLAAWLAPEAADPAAALAQGLWIVDPLGNLMMRFPDTRQPEGVRDDIRTLLKNSRIG
ncbi:MAG: SCO family protein [Castellaniella sp.]|uniref:SCO family protein n=1 Tax=Castellaniella sp. TaxID=1955812 RepID=UPI003A88969E